jgi:hypothetical protein
MSLLDNDDPITVLHQQIITTLRNHDGGTVMAALALTLTTTMAWAASKSKEPLPPDMLALRDALTLLIGDIVHARDGQRES